MITSVLDLLPSKGANTIDMSNFPKGKPDYRSVWSHGPARIITYIFGNSVYKKLSFHGKHILIKLKPEIIDGKGGFLR